MTDLISWLPFLGTLIVAAVTLIGIYAQRKRNDAETSEKISSAWERLLKPYDDRITRLESLNKHLLAENKMLWAYIDELRGILRENNIAAPPMPEIERVEE